MEGQSCENRFNAALSLINFDSLVRLDVLGDNMRASLHANVP